MQHPVISARVCDLRAILILALMVRWAYSAGLYAWLGDSGLLSGDSFGYLTVARQMAADALAGNLHGWDWLGIDVARMPLYPWFLMANVVVFGSAGAIATVLLQGLIDTGTCFFAAQIAGSIDRRIAIPTAAVAALNPTMVVLSGLVLTDTLFVFFATMAFYGAVRWMKQPSWSAAVVMGAGLGLAATDRVLIVPFVPVMLIVLLLSRSIVAGIKMSNVRQLVVAVIISCLGIAPVLARNVTHYGAWALTPQGGGHLAFWIVPLVREAKDGTLWAKGAADSQARITARFGEQSPNPFVNSRHNEEVAREELSELGFAAIVKAWAIGAGINLASPALIIAPPLANLPRSGFYETGAKTTFGKIYNFLFRSSGGIYAVVLLTGVAGVAAFRLVQAVGFFALVRDSVAWPALILLLLWIGFILAANGPIASPKYRLPIEPVLCILAGAGIQLLQRRRAVLSASPQTGA